MDEQIKKKKDLCSIFKPLKLSMSDHTDSAMTN